ncbi:MAG: tRNA (adenosine(37)-N6)-dimethylallyltransferase MiaA [Clostridiales bacterium]|jgi:tRNA dimethylallyltransferase|nr:tRNA (adenosine(37)-N6)-dimethylallyltransferase MiaA [Clostridiales bacterium]
MSKIIIVAGPTASGKTALAVKLAKTFNGEVISADSMQIYKRLDIGTAKPTESETDGVKHHLIDFVEPDAPYNAALYQKDARKIIDALIKADKTPILAGGTGLYINSVLYDMNFANSDKNPELRCELEKKYDKDGGAAMLEELSLSNPEVAAKLHVNDKKRVVRACETALIGKKTDGDEFNTKLYYNDYIFVTLNPDRARLYAKINERTDLMLKNGLTQEVKELIDTGLTFDMQSMQSIGYKEFEGYFFKGQPLESVAETIKQHTRNYAKRQITWFKRYKAKQFDTLDNNCLESVTDFVGSSLKA